MQAAASAPSWKDWADAAASAAQALAIVIGGAWAYFKFVKGRTFAKRVELAVTATVLPTRRPTLKVRATLRNAGLSKLPLRIQVVTVYGIYAAPTSANPIAMREAQLGKRKRIFKAHKWIEAQETVSDEILCLVPARDEELLAFRAECTIFARRRKPGALTWTASAVVPAEVEASDQAISSMGVAK
ncbi:MAG TPA: hypothetical protein VK488_05380 [Gaiellaceae bacterium]|nr:hypothetical protein [Gaiellaceae bacterium]